MKSTNYNFVVIPYFIFICRFRMSMIYEISKIKMLPKFERREEKFHMNIMKYHFVRAICLITLFQRDTIDRASKSEKPQFIQNYIDKYTCRMITWVKILVFINHNHTSESLYHDLYLSLSVRKIENILPAFTPTASYQ